MAKRDREAEKLIRLVPRRGPEKMGREAGGFARGLKALLYGLIFLVLIQVPGKHIFHWGLPGQKYHIFLRAKVPSSYKSTKLKIQTTCLDALLHRLLLL